MTPKQQGRLGLFHIEEAILAVLSGEPEGLTPAHISRRIGIRGYSDSHMSLKYAIVHGALDHLRRKELVDKLLENSRWKLIDYREEPTSRVNQEENSEGVPKPDLHEIRSALIEYIDRESRVLELDDFGEDDYIGYFCGYGHFKIWLTIWIGHGLDIMATRLMIGREYGKTFERLEEEMEKIRWLFPQEVVNCKSFPEGIKGIGIEKYVDLTQRDNWDETFSWVRENLEKLLNVIRIHDATQESSEDDIPF